MATFSDIRGYKIQGSISVVPTVATSLVWGNVPDEEPTEYLWFPYLPLGEITLLGGPPNVGKGLVAAHIVACATTGKGFPGDGGVPMPTNVIWGEAEDNHARTLSPRLAAAGADMYRIRLARIDDPMLRNMKATVHKHAVQLVVLSPLVSFLPGLENANDQMEVRKCLDKLLQQIEGTRCAILGLAHPNKQQNTTPMEKIMGSSAFVQHVRSIFVLAEQDNVEARRMAHVKYYNCTRGKDWLYNIQSEKQGCGRAWIEWTPAADRCVLETLWGSKAKKRQTALDFVMSYLAMHDGHAPAKEIMQAAHEAGINAYAVEKAVQRSKKVKASKDGFTGPWYWSVTTAG